MSDDLDNIEIKVSLIGEPEVGISSLIKIVMGTKFEDIYLYCPAQTYDKGTIIINNHSYPYILWDPYGIQRNRPMTKLFIKNAQIALIIFAINNKKSFEEVDYWYKYVKDNIGTNDEYIIVLVGNKSDLKEQQEVSNEEIEKKAKELNVKLKITSAKNDGEEFKKFFNELLEEYINMVHSNEIKAPLYKIEEKEKKNWKNKYKCNN